MTIKRLGPGAAVAQVGSEAVEFTWDVALHRWRMRRGTTTTVVGTLKR